MKALILAAGLGTRLAPLTDSVPKCMVKVNHLTIIEKQIENLISNDIKDITVVSGYKNDVLEAFVANKYPFIKFITNENYLNNNNMFSAYLARNYLSGESFYMMNADVFFDENIIAELSKDKYKNAIATQKGEYIEESMKIKYDGDKITAISKQIEKKEAYGTTIDVYKFSKEASEAFFQKCVDYIENKNELNLWSEVAINDIFNEINFIPCIIKGRWVEIDNFEDLTFAKSIFKD